MDRDLTIAAYVDGELSPAEAKDFEARLREDAILAAEVERVAAIRARLARAYAPVLNEPIPPHLVVLASAANDQGAGREHGWHAAGVAAALVLGALIGHAAWPPGGSFATEGGELVAQGKLARGLDSQLAGEAGVTRVGLTFRGPQQAWCRTFRWEEGRTSGVACRKNERWVIEALAPVKPSDNASQYRTAASDIPPALLVVVEQLRSGEALDAQQERAARDGRWR